MRYEKFKETVFIDKKPIETWQFINKQGIKCRATCQSCKFAKRLTPDKRMYFCDFSTNPTTNIDTCEAWEPREACEVIGSTAPGKVKSAAYLQFLVQNAKEIREHFSTLLLNAGTKAMDKINAGNVWDIMRKKYIETTGKTIYE